jgi:hypothetical protein
VELEAAVRREAAVLIGACHPGHSAFTLQPETLRDVWFQWWKLDLEANRRMDRRGRGSEYKCPQEADIASSTDALSVLS